MIKLNLIVIRTQNLEEISQWYSKTFDLNFVAEKHDNGVLHYSAQITEGIIEIYPTEQLNPKITFGLSVSKEIFEQIILNQSYKTLSEHVFLIKDLDGNSIILSFS